MTETWVQHYPDGHQPGPDGQPADVAGDLRAARELLVQSRVEYHPASRVRFRTTRNPSRGILQTWMRVR